MLVRFIRESQYKQAVAVFEKVLSCIMQTTDYSIKQDIFSRNFERWGKN